jgi:hypothetical protein
MGRLNCIAGMGAGSREEQKVTNTNPPDAESSTAHSFSPIAGPGGPGHAKPEKPLQSSPAVAAGGWLPVTALQSPSTSTPPPPPPSSSRHSLPARRAPRNLPFPDSVLWEASEIARRCRMESSSGEELEEEFPGHEWITPQSSVNAAYQSQTEKVRFLLPCSALQMFLLHSGQHTVGQWGISPAAVPCYFLLLWSLCGWGCLGLKSRNFGSRPVAMVLWWVISRR